MKQSQLFGPTWREISKEEVSKNAILLTRGGYIDKELAGVYTLLPMGLRVAEKIKAIIREELNKLPHTSEMLMPVLQPHALWEESGRREDIKSVMYDLKDVPIGLGPTHEEVITDMFRRFYGSYRNLPIGAYQIQTKFRNEPRAKSGLLRGREFMMKDLYSFHENEADLADYYNLVKDAYFGIFKRVGIHALFTEASGGVFSKRSHEFQVLSENGEDEIYLDQTEDLAWNKEIVDENDPEFLQFCEGRIDKRNAIEAGNIFKLNRKFSVPMNAKVTTKTGEQTEVWTASYGIGITRLIGTLAEVYGDLEKNKITWPKSVAPYKIHLIELGVGLGQDLYNQLSQFDQSDLLFDDRDESAGAKFADADLIGAPIRIIISPRTVEQNFVELSIHNNTSDGGASATPRRWTEGEPEFVKQSELIPRLTQL